LLGDIDLKPFYLTAKMYKRNIYDEDPWLSLRDHWDSPNDVMYGENRNIFHNNVRDHNGGMDVYIRKQFEYTGYTGYYFFPHSGWPTIQIQKK